MPETQAKKPKNPDSSMSVRGRSRIMGGNERTSTANTRANANLSITNSKDNNEITELGSNNENRQISNNNRNAAKKSVTDFDSIQEMKLKVGNMRMARIQLSLRKLHMEMAQADEALNELCAIAHIDKNAEM